MTTELMSLVQGIDEPLREFITRFNKEETTFPNMSQEVALLAMQSGLLPGSPFRAYMGRKSLKTLAEALGKAHEFIKADETDRAMLGRKAHGDSFKRSEVTRAENPPRVDQPSRAEQNRREADRAVGLRRCHIFSVDKADDKWQRPPRMVNRNRDTNKWSDFHRDHGHTTEECTHLKDNIEDLVRRGYLNQFKQHDDLPRRRDEDRAGLPDRRGGHRGPTGGRDIDGRPEGRVYVISGGLVHGGTVNRAQADLRAMIHQINYNDKRRWPPLPPQEVDRILIDGGSSTNIIYISAFNELNLDKKDLKWVSYEVTGFNGSRLSPEGIIELSVRVGERSRRRDVRAEFLVINFPSPYNVIKGRPLIHKIGGVVSTYHLAMAYASNEGRLAKLRGSQKTTQQCYITALKQPAKTRHQPSSERRPSEQPERKSRKRKREEYHREKNKQKLAMENFEPAKEEMARPLPSGEHVTVELTEGDPLRTVEIGKGIDPGVGVHLIEIMSKNKDVFAISADEMHEINPTVMVHRLNVKEDIKPVR
ncbi:uncharacterized protein LOC110702700 [Chenopodium quinoa]|uniref:uncharacterized protein LOC110702700 n=1 Tax=Chenopodium quinoa TaxID=63459 RepID=UPI000B788CB3|nr:uncharacterized protein LOC110702700 [Chenopodium quinoa]